MNDWNLDHLNSCDERWCPICHHILETARQLSADTWAVEHWLNCADAGCVLCAVDDDGHAVVPVD